jgi:hypothetical protein
MVGGIIDDPGPCLTSVTSDSSWTADIHALAEIAFRLTAVHCAECSCDQDQSRLHLVKEDPHGILIAQVEVEISWLAMLMHGADQVVSLGKGGTEGRSQLARCPDQEAPQTRSPLDLESAQRSDRHVLQRVASAA